MLHECVGVSVVHEVQTYQSNKKSLSMSARQCHALKSEPVVVVVVRAERNILAAEVDREDSRARRTFEFKNN